MGVNRVTDHIHGRFLLFARHVAELMVLKEGPVTQAMGRQAVGKGVFGDEGV